MNSHMTYVAHHQGFASSGNHTLRPGWFFFPSRLLEVGKFVDVVYFDMLR